MLRRLSLTVCLFPLLLATPALAATPAEKMETCKIGADSQNLKGAKRDSFIKRCMASGNYEPEARRKATSAAPKQN
ncbi:MAG: PsiF family protein [Pseudolabrys sp.]